MSNYFADESDFYPAPQKYIECGAGEDEICAGTSDGPLCGPCWNAREREKKLRAAEREKEK